MSVIAFLYDLSLGQSSPWTRVSYVTPAINAASSANRIANIERFYFSSNVILSQHAFCRDTAKEAARERMMLELYNAPVSTCSQKVRMALFEKELPWIDKTIQFARRDHLSDWYLTLNPNGVVPTLVHDGHVIIDSSVINEYLEDVFPTHALRPTGAVETAHMRAWRQYIDEVSTPAVRYPSFNAAFVHIWADMTDEEYRAHVDQLPLRKHFYLKMGRTGFPKEEVDAALERLRQTVERMERSFERTQWLASDHFTLADISIMPTIVRMDDLGLGYLWTDLPAVADWYRRIQSRHAFVQTYPAGSRDIHPSC